MTTDGSDLPAPTITATITDAYRKVRVKEPRRPRAGRKPEPSARRAKAKYRADPAVRGMDTVIAYRAWEKARDAHRRAEANFGLLAAKLETE